MPNDRPRASRKQSPYQSDFILKPTIEWDHASAPAWQKAIPDAPSMARKAAFKTCRKLPAPTLAHRMNVTIFLTNDKKQCRLNNMYRGKNRSTNILAFESHTKIKTGYHLGDLSLALGTIRKEAKVQGKSIEDHFCHLVVHGLLHLLGFDHQTKRDAKKMEALEIAVLNDMKIKNPYEVEGGKFDSE